MASTKSKSTAKSNLGPSKPKEVITAEEIIDSAVLPEIKALLEWATANGKVEKQRLITDMRDNKSLSGSFDPRDKSLKVQAAPFRLNEGILHELVHAITTGESNTKKFSNAYDKMRAKDLIFKQDVVMPKHWSQGMVDDPLIGRGVEVPLITGKSVSLKTAPGYLVRPGNRLDQYGRETFEKMSNAVTKRIPPGHHWSSLTLKDGSMPPSTLHEEIIPRYTTDTRVAGKEKDSAAMLGLYLLDYGVPMKIVEPLVNRWDSMKALWQEPPRDSTNEVTNDARTQGR